MPVFPVVTVATSATAAAHIQLVSPLRSLFLRNMNTAAGDYIIVTFDSGEIFRIKENEELILTAEDTSPEATAGKIFSRQIQLFGNAANPVTIQGNYTAWVPQYLQNPTPIITA